MALCSFCGNELKKGTGMMYVKKDGTVLYYCSSKCFKNSRLKREGRRKKWTTAYREFTGKNKKKTAANKKKNN